MFRYYFFLIILLLFNSCGGDGTLLQTINQEDDNTKYQITAIDGYIKNALIVDSNGTIAKYDETLKHGIYYFDKRPIGIITLTNGQLEDTNETLDINLTCDYNYSKIISPITTFIQGNYILENKYKSILQLDDLNIDYISTNNQDLAKLSQLFYLMLKNKNLEYSHKEYIKTHDISSFDEVFNEIKNDINNSNIDNKNMLKFFVDRVESFDDNVSIFEDYLKDYKTSINISINTIPIFATDINSTLLYDDGYYHKGLEHNFTRDDDLEIVTDNTLNIQWQDTTNNILYNQNDAQLYCQNLDLNGTGWRVPTIKELQTIRDFNNSNNGFYPVFINTNNKEYLTSSREARNDTISIYFWNIDFTSGKEILSNYYYRSYLKCIRNTKEYNNSILLSNKINNDDVIYDSSNNLLWQDNEDNVNLLNNYYQSIEYCHSLNYAGFDDWRLPNINELNSIYDKSSTDSSFLNMSNNSYWSSTSYKANMDQAWVILNDKAINLDSKNNFNNLRCVRDY